MYFFGACGEGPWGHRGMGKGATEGAVAALLPHPCPLRVVNTRSSVVAWVLRPRTGSPLTWGCVEWWALPPHRLNHPDAYPAAGTGNLLWGAHVGLDQGTVTCQGPLGLAALQLPRSRHPGCDM